MSSLWRSKKRRRKENAHLSRCDKCGNETWWFVEIERLNRAGIFANGARGAARCVRLTITCCVRSMRLHTARARRTCYAILRSWYLAIKEKINRRVCAFPFAQCLCYAISWAINAWSLFLRRSFDRYKKFINANYLLTNWVSRDVTI